MLDKHQKLSNMINNSLKFICLLFVVALLIVGCSKDDGPKNPTSSELIFPLNGENCNTGTSISGAKSNVDFSWIEASNTDSYFLEITNLQTNDKTKRAGINTNLATVALDKGYGYEWFVTSISNKVPTERPVSETWRFYLQGDGETNSAPFTAELISPDSGESVQLTDGSFNFVWSGKDPDGDSILYTLFLDTIDGLQTPPESQIDISSSNFVIDLEIDKVYYWSVFSRDSKNNTSHSQVHSFRVVE